jgi:AsmA protein
MRRILTTLMILLAVIVAGLTSLVLLVNPNDFRAYMVHEVAERSGYQLELDGPLRWHVWPQLSILSGRMTLTARGAEEPVIRADNMRLDVALLPLLSHQLQVKQVMLKGAVIQLTPKTEAVRDRMRRWCRMTTPCRWPRRIAAGPTMCGSCRWPTACSSSSMRTASR